MYRNEIRRATLCGHISGCMTRAAGPWRFAGQLFVAMGTGGFFGADELAYFNGRLCNDDTVLTLDSAGLDTLARVSQLDWSSIEPSIFGALFERSLDLFRRSQLGAH